MKHTVQEQIASLMGSGTLGDTGLMNNAGMTDNDELDTAPVSQVLDGRANTVQTQLKACSASSCAHNSDGQRCTKTFITVSETGGCEDYEASADEYDQRDAAEEQAIMGISTMMPAQAEHPSAIQNMANKFNPNAMR